MCKYCWHPADFVTPTSVLKDGVNHNPGCPVIEGNFEDWEAGFDWGWNNSTERVLPKNKNKAFYFGVRAGKNEMNRLVEDAAEDNYYGVHEREY